MVLSRRPPLNDWPTRLRRTPRRTAAGWSPRQRAASTATESGPGITLDDLRAIQQQLTAAEARIANVLALCDEADRQGIISGGSFQVNIVRAAANATSAQ
ncbi:hypothetical protein GTY38_19905 [Streptomyces sp. SID8369]|uniref:hypothetical protein n=1 Tax=Streptomyces TaxID=1883 RepID=UPI00115FF01F|nr:hypothetical protein [Streptomyces sp. LaPpAH-199]MYW80338.1 hypothetical protein [Streptomyces sp. SID8369]